MRRKKKIKSICYQTQENNVKLNFPKKRFYDYRGYRNYKYKKL